MPASQIRINKTKELQEVLTILRSQYRLLSDAEIIKLALSLMYMLTEQQERKVWEDSLPAIKFTKLQQESLSESLAEHAQMKNKGEGRTMTAREVMDELSS